MTADVSDVLVVVVLCFFAVTKPASICNQKKFRNHENNSLQITRQSLIGVVIPLYYSNIRIFSGISADYQQTKYGGEIGYRRRLGCLIALNTRSVSNVQSSPCLIPDHTRPTSFVWARIIKTVVDS